jgi:hypothetical protein
VKRLPSSLLYDVARCQHSGKARPTGSRTGLFERAERRLPGNDGHVHAQSVIVTALAAKRWFGTIFLGDFKLEPGQASSQFFICWGSFLPPVYWFARPLAGPCPTLCPSTGHDGHCIDTICIGTGSSGGNPDGNPLPQNEGGAGRISVAMGLANLPDFSNSALHSSADSFCSLVW